MTEYSTVKNLGAIFDAHVKAEFIDKDVAATMATMVAEPYLTHVPTLTGGTGRSEVECFYRDHFVGHWPDDVDVKPLSRTVGQNRVVDELIVSFTHDREMRAYLPGATRPASSKPITTTCGNTTFRPVAGTRSKISVSSSRLTWRKDSVLNRLSDFRSGRPTASVSSSQNLSVMHIMKTHPSAVGNVCTGTRT
jgi:hypothetical protein